MIISWRTLSVTRPGRACPDMDCEAVFEPSEWKAVFQVTQKRSPPKTPPKPQELVRMVAQLGGYVNRPRADEPETDTVWKALQRMHDMAACRDLFGTGREERDDSTELITNGITSSNRQHCGPLSSVAAVAPRPDRW
ncbi:MAG: IS4 family transposase [Planctomycetota bacterium]